MPRDSSNKGHSLLSNIDSILSHRVGLMPDKTRLIFRRSLESLELRPTKLIFIHDICIMLKIVSLFFKNILCKYASVLLIVMSVQNASSDESLTLPDFELGRGSKVFDLANTPIGITILQEIGFQFRDNRFKKKLEGAINDVAPKIISDLQGVRAGYLIRVNSYISEHGALSIPGGQIITPIGRGLEPVDALAEDKRRPRLVNAPVPGYKDESSYYWLYLDNEELKAKYLPPSMRAHLEKAAHKEARRRNLMGSFVRSQEDGSLQRIQRASLWKEIYEKRANLVKDQLRADKIRRLNQEMAQLQSYANSLYEKYQELTKKIAEEQSRAAAFRFALDVSQVIVSGVKAGYLLKDGVGVDTQQGPVKSPEGEIIYSRERVLEYEGQRSVFRESITVKIDKFRSLDIQLRDQWEKSNVPTQDVPRVSFPDLPIGGQK